MPMKGLNDSHHKLREGVLTFPSGYFPSGYSPQSLNGRSSVSAQLVTLSVVVPRECYSNTSDNSYLVHNGSTQPKSGNISDFGGSSIACNQGGLSTCKCCDLWICVKPDQSDPGTHVPGSPKIRIMVHG